MAPLIGVLFILGPFNFFGHVYLVSATLSVATLMFPALSSTQTSIWVTLCAVSFIGMFYLVKVWSFTRGNCVTKNYALTLCSFQTFMAFALSYFLIPVVKHTGELAYFCTIALIILQIWSAIVTLLFLQEKVALSAVGN